MRKRIPIPEPVKRQIRQEAGFGCYACGRPIFQYHHLVRNSIKPEDIMILCIDHHDMATKGAMTKTEQEHYKKHPYNIENNFVKGQLIIHQQAPVVRAGTNLFIGKGEIVNVNDENLFSILNIDGRIEISILLYDENDILVAEIINNEWVSGDPLPWDLESGYRWLKIKSKQRKIELEIDAKSFPISLRANFWHNRHNILFSPKDIVINGTRIHNIRFSSCVIQGNIQIDTDSEGETKMATIKSIDIDFPPNCKHTLMKVDTTTAGFYYLVCSKCGFWKTLTIASA